VKLRRALGAFVAFAFFATMMVPLPALAANSLEVLVLDPLAAHSLGAAGVAPFDATTFVPPNTNPGTSAGSTTHVIRTNDTITYDVQYSVNGSDATTLTVTSTLPTNAGTPVADFTGFAAPCNSSSSITPDGQTLTCVIGTVTQGSAAEFLTSVKVRASTPNGFTISPSFTIADTGSANFSSQNTSGYSQSQGVLSTGSDAFDTVTSVSKADILKTTTNLSTNYIGSTTAPGGTTPQIVATYNGVGGVPGYFVTYPVLVQEGTGSGTAGVGIAPGPNPILITDTITTGVTAENPGSNMCGPNGSGITIPGEPYGFVGVTGSATASNSVAAGNAQVWSCSIVGGVISISIAGASTLGTTYPINNVTASAPYGPGVESATWIVSGYVRVFVPTNGFGGAAQPFSDAYTSTSLPVTPPGVSQNLPVQPPAGGSGSAGKVFVSNVSETPLSPQIAGSPPIPAVNAGQEVVAAFTVSNTTNAALGNTDLINNVVCDAINTSQFTITPFDGTTNPGPSATTGDAYNITGASTAPGLVVQYGDTTSASDCGASAEPAANPSTVTTGWYSTVAAVPGGAGNIVRVRVLGAIPVGDRVHVQLNVTIKGSLTAGTNISNSISEFGTPSAMGSGVPNNAAIFTTGATAPARVFQEIVSAQKQLFKTTAGASLFGQTTPGTAGFVDTNQEFVGFLDTIGTQNTITSAGTIMCDSIDTTKYVLAPFDGITGPVNATYGGPVAFSGTPPGGTTVEYSVDSADPTCRTGTWVPSTGVLPALGSIIRVRATFDLPPVTNLRMYVNFQAKSGLATGTVLTNNMVISNAAAPATAIPANNHTTIENEILTVVKSGPGSVVTAGAQASYTLTPKIQGVQSAQSGLVSVTDTLPQNLAYVPGSAELTPPSAPTTYIAGTGSATPDSVTTDPVSGITTIVWHVGQMGPSPGNIVTLPTITYSAIPSITVLDGVTLTNNVVESVTDPGIATASASKTITISNAGAFHVTKTTSTPTIGIGTPQTISWQLTYANTGANPANSTDFIDELPYPGDARGTSYHGTLTLATPTVGSTGPNGETFRYTKAAHGQINDDPGCVSNGGAVANGVGLCSATSFPTTVWCSTLSGGTCPASLAEVTALRIGGGALPANSGARNVTVTATATADVFTDKYWNNFAGRMDISTQGVQSPPVETQVPTPPSPFLTLVKSCIAPPTCITAAQAPGTDITYGIAATNTGGHASAQVVITDPMPPNMDFKVGTASATFPGGVTIVVSYSSDPAASTFTYTPVSGGGGAATGYDRNVTGVRWTMTAGQLAAVGVNDSGSVQFTAAIR
jgi:uncharacterized repeat protein (TIGR01451 family)